MKEGTRTPLHKTDKKNSDKRNIFHMNTIQLLGSNGQNHYYQLLEPKRPLKIAKEMDCVIMAF